MKTYVIAEIGLNHQGKLDTAKELIYEARNAGCDAAKFQTYLLSERTDPSSPYYDLFKECCLSYDDFVVLKDYANDVGISFFSTPFGITSLKFLAQDLQCSKIKISSFDVSNKQFLDEINKYSVDVIMSVGMANLSEIDKALEKLNNICRLSLLHCVSSYPMPNEQANLAAIQMIKDEFSSSISSVGYSDHSDGINIPALSVLCGASIVEKHFTLNKDNGAVDNPVSADPVMMAEMVNLIRQYESIYGDGRIGLKEIEKAALSFRRSS